MLINFAKKLAMDSDRPVFLMELRRRPKKWISHLPAMIFLALSVVASAWVLITCSHVTFNYGPPGEDLLYAVSWCQLVWVLISAGASASRAISSERESQTFDQLALTSLTSAQIIDQKVAAVTLNALMFSLSSLPLFISVCLINVSNPMGVFPLILMYILLPLLAAVVGYIAISMSIYSSTATATASVLSVVLIYGFLIGPESYLLLQLCGNTLNNGSIANGIKIIALLITVAVVFLLMFVRVKRETDTNEKRACAIRAIVYAAITIAIFGGVDWRSAGMWLMFHIINNMNAISPFGILSMLFRGSYSSMMPISPGFLYYWLPMPASRGFFVNNGYGTPITVLCIWALLILLFRYTALRKLDAARLGRGKWYWILGRLSQ